jgi:hypothetical protein
MGIWPSDWAKGILIEGNKFWFYALVFSIVLSLYQLFADYASPGISLKSEKHAALTLLTARTKKRRAIKRKLIGDMCDLLIPSFVLGWIPVGSATAGFASCVSSVISMGDIWEGMR